MPELTISWVGPNSTQAVPVPVPVAVACVACAVA